MSLKHLQFINKLLKFLKGNVYVNTNNSTSSSCSAGFINPQEHGKRSCSWPSPVSCAVHYSYLHVKVKYI